VLLHTSPADASLPAPSALSPADFEYEVAWQGLASLKFNRWIPRAELIDKGFRKFVVEFDQRLAANALGNDARPLSKETITKFLQDFGLEPEFGVHSNIRGLSGGCVRAVVFGVGGVMSLLGGVVGAVVHHQGSVS
jgi:hypothetical protein